MDKQCVLVTGANGGIGKEACSQLASKGFQTVILTCRSVEKGEAAVQDLVETTGVPKSTFKVVRLDLSDQESCQNAVKELPMLDKLLLNAGGSSSPTELADSGVTKMVSQNVLGNVMFLEALISANKLNPHARVVLTGSLKAADAKFVASDVASIKAHLTGKEECSYAIAKAAAALYMAAMSRRHPKLHLVTMCPGPTMGTNVYRNKSCCFTACFVPLFTCLGIYKGVDKAAARLLLPLCDDSSDDRYPSGSFWAAPGKGKFPPRGNPWNQSKRNWMYSDTPEAIEIQDNVHEALHDFISNA